MLHLLLTLGEADALLRALDTVRVAELARNRREKAGTLVHEEAAEAETSRCDVKRPMKRGAYTIPYTTSRKFLSTSTSDGVDKCNALWYYRGAGQPEKQPGSARK